MGEYFKWANYDKRKVLSNDLWNEGISLTCFTFAGSGRNDAVATLLAGPWAGDRVILCGDEACFSDDDDNALKRELSSLRPDDLPYDWDDDPEREAGGLLRIARGRAREVWLDGRCPPVELPFEGPFSLEVAKVRYVVNESKMEYVDRLRGPVLRVFPGRVQREDIFPLLCCSRDPYVERDPEGRWFGDRLRASDVRPGPSYLDVSAAYEHWGARTELSDEEILAAYAASGFGEDGAFAERGDLAELLRKHRAPKEGEDGKA